MRILAWVCIAAGLAILAMALPRIWFAAGFGGFFLFWLGGSLLAAGFVTLVAAKAFA